MRLRLGGDGEAGATLTATACEYVLAARSS